MKTIMVQYKTKKAHADENAVLIRAVFKALHASAPSGFRYSSYRLEDGVSFVHLATVDAKNPLISLPEFQAFQKDIKKRCSKQPVVTEASAVGSYGTTP